MSYANALKKTTKEYPGKSTVIASIKNIDITLEELATELRDQNLYDLVEGIQISHNKKFVEIIIHHDEAKQFLISEGINFGNTLITFRPKFKKERYFSIIHHNIHSLQAHIEEFKLLSQCLHFSFDIIAFSESKLQKDNIPLVNIDLPNYSYEHTPTEATKGGTLMRLRIQNSKL